MDHKQLRAFLTIADTGNMTRASEQLNLVQPAVSRQLRMLEDDIGAKLFERKRHGMALTDAGKSLLGYARRAMLELDRARAELSGSPAEVAGIVTIGLLPSTSDLLASALVAAVARHHPRIQMRIAMGYAGNLQQWLASGEIDAAVLYDVEHETAIQAQALVVEPLWLIGPPNAKLNKRRLVTFASLVGKPMILPNGPHGIRSLVDRICAVAKVRLTVSVETNAMSIQKALVLGGHGFTILPPIAVAQELAAGVLSGAPVGDPPLTRTIVLALPAHRAKSRHVRHVEEILRACIQHAVLSHQWPQALWIGG